MSTLLDAMAGVVITADVGDRRSADRLSAIEQTVGDRRKPLVTKTASMGKDSKQVADDSRSDAELAQYNLTLTVGWIALADTKATVFLTIAMSVLGASLTDLPAAARVSYACVNSESYWCLGGIVSAHLAFYVALAVSLWRFITVVRPLLIPKSDKHSWFFFQSMSLLSPEDFHGFTDNLDSDMKLEQLNDQIYNNAVVARQKYAAVASGIYALLLASICGVLAVAPVLVADAILSKG